MIRNIVSGGAASSVLACSTGTELKVVDVGSFGPPILGEVKNYRCRRVRAGSRNLGQEPALTLEEFDQALAIGREEAAEAALSGSVVVAAGEMGIANSTSASCLTALLTGLPVESVIGRGAGANDDTLARKRAVAARAVEVARGRFHSDRRAAIASVSGLEIVALAGFFQASADLGLTIILDGFIATAAALIAEQLRPGASKTMIAAHRSAEPGHAAALASLGLEPFLDTWNMRLGEGTGALLLMPLLDAAAAIVTGMATFASTGIVAGGAEGDPA